MTELLLPRLKQEIEARLAELRPLVAEIEQLEAAKAALLARSEAPLSPAVAKVARVASTRRRVARNGAATAPVSTPTRRRRSAARANGEAADGARAPRGANRDAILELVEERPGVSVAEIASVTKIPKATVATTVSKLKRDGVLASEAGGVKLASRQPLTLSGGTVEEKPARGDAVSDAEWEGAAPDDAASRDAAAQATARGRARA